MIKIFIIDDSLLVRNSFVKLLTPYDDIEILGVAENPIDAFDIFKNFD